MTCQIPVVIDGDGFGLAAVSDVDMDARPWHLYRYANEAEDISVPGLYATTNREKSKLIDIIGVASTMLYDLNTGSVKANHVLDVYNRFVKWRAELRDNLKDLGDRQTPARPHVLSLWYV